MRSKRSSRLTFLICVLVSAGIHAALFQKARYWTFGTGVPGVPRTARDREYKVAPPGTKPDPPPRTPIGEAGGTGVSFNSSPGDEPQTGLRSVADQADFTRKLTGENPDAPPPPKPMPRAVVAPPPAALPTPPVSTLQAFRKPAPPKPKAPPAEQAKATPPMPPTATIAGGTPRPHSDQDAHLFAKQVSAQYQRGRVVAAPGRKVKFTEPLLNLAAWMDAGLRNGDDIKLRIKVNADGSADDVVVFESTGSPGIDRAFVLAAFKSWYEPAKATDGQGIADEIDFTINFQSQR